MNQIIAGAANVSRTRFWLALIALALGGFGIGSTEFAAMGLLPEIAQNLLPDLYLVSAEKAHAKASWLISAYALGVVVGAPTIAVFAAKLPRKKLLLCLLVFFTLGTVASALAPTFELVILARFLSALPHGAYFGIASLVAASLMGPGKRGQGVAFVISGLTIANIIGVPLVTWLGQNQGWRASYFVIAGIFAATFFAIAAFVPWQPGDPKATVRNELKAFLRLQLWLTLLVGAIGFGGFFAVYTFVAPLATDVTKIDPGVVPSILVLIGVGMTVGNFYGGWLADRSLKRGMLFLFGVLFIGLVALFLTATWFVGLLVSIFIVSAACSAIAPAIQTRLMDVAQDSQAIAAALNHAALNIANAAGAFLGGVTIAAGFGYLSPIVVGAILCIAGIIIAIISFALDRRSARRFLVVR